MYARHLPFICDAHPTMTGMLSARTGDCPPSKEESQGPEFLENRRGA
jgi:hypothetical protein